MASVQRRRPNDWFGVKTTDAARLRKQLRQTKGIGSTMNAKNRVKNFGLLIVIALAVALVAPVFATNNTVLAQESQDTTTTGEGTNPAEVYGLTVTEGCETSYKVPATEGPDLLFSYSTGDEVAKQHLDFCIAANTVAVYDGFGLNGQLDGQDVAIVNNTDKNLQIHVNEMWSARLKVVFPAYGETVFWNTIVRLLDNGQVHGTIRPLCGWTAPSMVTDRTNISDCVGPIEVFEGVGNGTPTEDVDGDGKITDEINDISSTCPAVGTINCLPRSQSGQDKTIDFEAGSTVEGNTIVSDGVTYTNCRGFFTKAGKVTTGVVNYWPAESVYSDNCADQVA